MDIDIVFKPSNRTVVSDLPVVPRIGELIALETPDRAERVEGYLVRKVVYSLSESGRLERITVVTEPEPWNGPPTEAVPE